MGRLLNYNQLVSASDMWLAGWLPQWPAFISACHYSGYKIRDICKAWHDSIHRLSGIRVGIIAKTSRIEYGEYQSKEIILC